MAEINIDRLIGYEIWKIRTGNIDENTNPTLLADVLEYFDEDLWIKTNPKKCNPVYNKMFGRFNKGKIRKIIDKKLKITDVAISYSLKVRGNKCVCPFHEDKDPSLILNDNQNTFHCFGCHIKGDIVEFIRRLEELR
jgi:hypothetical protein